jgi:hypothetical protein
LTRDRAQMFDKIADFEVKKEEWRRHSKEIENYFQTQLMEIRSNFDM